MASAGEYLTKEYAMYAVLDRRNCGHLQCICEPCFAEHLRRNDFDTAECVLSVRRDDRPESVFKIYDRDEIIKNLVITPENIDQALNSWISLWEQQAGPV